MLEPNGKRELIWQIFCQNTILSKKKKHEKFAKRTDYFDYMDGFRGFCSATVIIGHYLGVNSLQGDYRIFYGLGHEIGVMGFFVMSSFLLTYLFVKELVKTLEKHRECLSARNSLKIFFKLATKYAIKRFFRIYVPLLVFIMMYWARNVIGFDVMGPWYQDKLSYFKMITLNDFSHTHLWTLSVQCRYYAIIPFMCFIVVKLKRIAAITILSMASFVLLNEKHNFTQTNGFNTFEQRQLMGTYFTMLLSGSIAAFFCHFYSNSIKQRGVDFQKPATNRIVTILFYLFAIFYMYNYANCWHQYELTYERLVKCFFGIERPKLVFHVQSGVLMSCAFVAAYFTAPNGFTNWFRDSSLLKYFGKYGYSVYLFHGLAIVCAVQLGEFNTNMEAILAVFLFTFLFGFIYYYLVENPFMNIGTILAAKVDNIQCLRVENYGILNV